MEIRDRILRTMKELAAKKGFRAVTMTELAAASGVSKRTLYRHFRSKSELVELVVDGLLADVERRVKEIVTGAATPPEKLRGVMRVVVEEASRFTGPRDFSDLERHYPQLWDKIDRLRSDRIKHLKQVYLDGCNLGYFRDVNPDVLLAGYLGSLRGVINPNFLSNNALSLEQALNTLLDIFLNGILERS
ncbi:MAG: TetR/AcrR family transcriptional regulator [Ammonifex sp.]|jgi:AcrR family transcriptional regulator|nr:MAG: TetR/AcrR family transcriptional regulator [Ammonifex sp.]